MMHQSVDTAVGGKQLKTRKPQTASTRGLTPKSADRYRNKQKMTDSGGTVAHQKTPKLKSFPPGFIVRGESQSAAAVQNKNSKASRYSNVHLPTHLKKQMSSNNAGGGQRNKNSTAAIVNKQQESLAFIMSPPSTTTKENSLAARRTSHQPTASNRTTIQGNTTMTTFNKTNYRNSVQDNAVTIEHNASSQENMIVKMPDSNSRKPQQLRSQSNTFRNDKNSILTPKTRHTVNQLNQFISDLTTRDVPTLPKTSLQLKRQRTAANSSLIPKVTSTIEQQSIGGVPQLRMPSQQQQSRQQVTKSSALTARQPSIKNTMGRNFTRNTVAHTISRELSQNAFTVVEGATLQQHLIMQSLNVNGMIIDQELPFNGQGVKLNISSGDKLPEESPQSSAVLLQKRNNQKNNLRKSIQCHMINEQSKCGEDSTQNQNNRTLEQYIDRGPVPLDRHSSTPQLIESISDMSALTLNRRKTREDSNLLVGSTFKARLDSQRNTMQPFKPKKLASAEGVDNDIHAIKTLTARKTKWSAHPIRFLIRLRPAETSPNKSPNNRQTIPIHISYPSQQNRSQTEQQMNSPTVHLVDYETTQCDDVLDAQASQLNVFQQAKPMVKKFLGGTNCTVLAYGPSGSGKTHTLLGAPFYNCLQLDTNQHTPIGSIGSSPLKISKKQSLLVKQFKASSVGKRQMRQLNSMNTETYMATPKKNMAIEQLSQAPTVGLQIMRLLQEMIKSEGCGLAVRLIMAVFESIKRRSLDVTVSCSFIQLHFDNIIDLLPQGPEESQNSSLFQSLKIKDTSSIQQNQSPFKPAVQTNQNTAIIEGLSEYKVSNEWDCLNLLRLGERNRVIRMKRLDLKGSSRSSSLFQLQIHSNQKDRSGVYKISSKFNICDLAGSDKISAQEEIDARHLIELRKLNLSVKSIEKVITAISAQQNTNQQQSSTRQPIPYRESKLTRILADSLSQKTLFITTLSPQLSQVEETAASLQFINSARNNLTMTDQISFNRLNLLQKAMSKEDQPLLYQSPTKHNDLSQQPSMELRNQKQLYHVTQLSLLNKQSQENQKRIDTLQREVIEFKSHALVQQQKPNPTALKVIEGERGRLQQDNQQLASQIQTLKQQHAKNILTQQQSQSLYTDEKESQAIIITEQDTVSKQIASVAGAINLFEDQSNFGSSPSVSKLRGLKSTPSLIAKPGSAVKMLTQKSLVNVMVMIDESPLKLHSIKSQLSNEDVDDNVQEGAHQLLTKLRLTNTTGKKDQKQSLGEHLVSLASSRTSLSIPLTKYSKEETNKPSVLLKSNNKTGKTKSSIPDFALTNQVKLQVNAGQGIPGILSQRSSFNNTVIRPIVTIYTKEFIKKLIEKANNQVSEILTKFLDFHFLRQGAHITTKVETVKWKPMIVTQLPADFDKKDTIDTPTRPLAHGRRESQVSLDQPCPKGKQKAPLQDFEDNEGELGIYNDMNSSMQELDQSFYQAAQMNQGYFKPQSVQQAFFEAKGNFDVFADKIKALQDASSINSPINASFINSEGAAMNIFNFNGHIGEVKDKCPNLLQRSRETSGASINRTGTITNRNLNSSTSTTRRSHGSFVGGLGQQRRRLLPSPFFKPSPERQAARQADGWCQYGNSIGNGSIIYARPPDSKLKKKVAPKIVKQQSQYFEGAGYVNDTESDYRGLAGLPQGNLFHKGKAVPRGMLAPSQWSKKKLGNRPESPIEYDFRGRRVTPKESQNVSHELPGPRPKFINNDNIIKAPSTKPREYNPGNYSRVGVSALTTPADQEKSNPSTGKNSIIASKRASLVSDLIGTAAHWGQTNYL